MLPCGCSCTYTCQLKEEVLPRQPARTVYGSELLMLVHLLLPS